MIEVMLATSLLCIGLLCIFGLFLIVGFAIGFGTIWLNKPR